MNGGPIIVRLRRDLRLADNPALAAAAATGRPVIPVAFRDEWADALPSAPLWRWGLGLAAFDAALRSIGSRLTFRSGPAERALARLVAETGATAIHWNRLYDPATVDADKSLKSWGRAAGLECMSFAAHTLAEPWEIETASGGPFRVFTPFWKALSARPVPPTLSPVHRLAAPSVWPDSEALLDWRLGDRMNQGAAVVRPWLRVGEAAAGERLARFLDGPVNDYGEARDRLDRDGTSGLSENLAWGEITARTVWHAAIGPRQAGAGGADKFLSEIGWREFAWHLLWHFPHLAARSWRPEWEHFPWRPDNAEAEMWRRGLTGEPLVDAAMRELWVTGRMHNRARMVAASFLTKHLLTDWRVGQAFFAETLVDWDPASNALGWQWVAGSGPDAAPFFRIFNPALQAERHDPDGTYRRRWIAEGETAPEPTALSFFEAVPRSWRLSPAEPYPAPIIDLAAGRRRALEAHASLLR